MIPKTAAARVLVHSRFVRSGAYRSDALRCVASSFSASLAVRSRRNAPQRTTTHRFGVRLAQVEHPKRSDVMSVVVTILDRNSREGNGYSRINHEGLSVIDANRLERIDYGHYAD